MIGMAVGVLAMAAAFSGAMTMQRTFVATEEFSNDQREQTRLSDYLALDLRRALTVEGASGDILLKVTIPNFYDSDRKPLTPKVVKTPKSTYAVEYAPDPVAVVYRKAGSTITRQEGTSDPVVIAANVADFETLVVGIGSKEFLDTKISFRPSFQRSGNAAAAQPGTTVYNTVRLRNIQ